ncbi:MAG: acylphosphatase [Dehalococcoidia bacterium]|nr:acylphosphatase [Dehalococcoidia bacterium]MDD5647565.1 acylphosphatase [Dehalococcoidia bacterium]
MSDLARLKAIVHGRVQGVYYRAFTFRIAKSLSLKGWVKNSLSGDVEVQAEGDREDLEALLKQLKMGPEGASVSKIDVTWVDYAGDFSGFNVRY